MTPEERKRGLRAAVDAQCSGYLQKHSWTGVMTFERDRLWEVIDSLVDECAVSPSGRLIAAIAEYRRWFDTCTRTFADNWEELATTASLELDSALAPMGGSIHNPDCPKCNGPWPWCVACLSYHSPCNPTCKANIRPADTAGYSDRLDADRQITTEEKIASCLFAYQEENSDPDHTDQTLTMEDCGDLGRQILRMVLAEFRPDLFDPATTGTVKVVGEILTPDQLRRICNVLRDVTGLVECNCSTAGCEGNCTYAEATKLLEEL